MPAGGRVHSPSRQDVAAQTDVGLLWMEVVMATALRDTHHIHVYTLSDSRSTKSFYQAFAYRRLGQAKQNLQFTLLG